MHLSEGGKAAEVMYGPCLVGIFINLFLYGVVVAQIRTYYETFSKDPIWIKIYVFALLLADTLNCAFNMAWIYGVLVNQFGNLTALKEVDWLFSSEEAMAGVIATMVQLFFGWRLWVLTRNPWVVAVVVFSSSVSGLCAIGTAIGITMKREVAAFQDLDVIAIPWLVACTVCDVFIAISLSLYLSKHKTGFQNTDSVVNRIIRSTVQNGLLTASCTIAHIVAYLASQTGIHMVFNYMVVKLYTNSVLSRLNSRKDWAQSLSGDSSGNKGVNMTNFVTAHRSIHPQVTINVETHEMVEVDPKVKRHPEWPDVVSSSSSNKSMSGDRTKDSAYTM